MAGPWENYQPAPPAPVTDGPWKYFQKSKPVVTLGPEGFKKSMQEAIEADVSPTGAKLVAGAGTALDNAALRLKQMFSTLTPQDVNQVQANRAITDTGAGLFGNIAGNIAMLGAPAAAATTALVPQAARVLPNMLAPTAAAAGVNAVIAPATTPQIGDETALRNAAIGAIGGAGGDLVSRGLARIAQPVIQSDAVQTLLRHGVVPTVGQAAGKNSLVGRAEQALESVPVIGSVVGGARNRAGVEFNRAALNQAIPEGQPNVTQIGNLGRDEVRDANRRNYEGLFAGRQVNPDANLAHVLTQARDSTQLPLSANGSRQFDAIIQRNLWDRIPTVNVGQGATPQIGADAMKREIIGDLGRIANEYSRSPIAEERAVGEALRNARNATQRWLVDAAGIRRGDVLAADTAYTAAAATRDAAQRGMAQEGRFTPLQLMRESAPNSASHRLATAGQEVLPNTLPNSGTADRSMLAALLALGATGGGAATLGTPATLAAAALAPLAYSRTGSRYMVGDLMPRAQNTLSQLLRNNAPQGGIAGQNALLNLLQQGQ